MIKGLRQLAAKPEKIASDIFLCDFKELNLYLKKIILVIYTEKCALNRFQFLYY